MFSRRRALFRADSWLTLCVSSAAIDTAVQSYVAEHFPTGVATTFGHTDNIVITIVGNKYNPRNYWCVPTIW